MRLRYEPYRRTSRLFESIYYYIISEFKGKYDNIKGKKLKKIYFWACDIDQHRGEGILGQQFIDLAIKNNNLESEVETFNKKFF